MRSVSLLLRTSLTLGISGLAIALVTVLAVERFVTRPLAERSADDEAALLVLYAQTWVELPPLARPYFEVELVENHGLVVSPQPLSLEPLDSSPLWMELMQEKLDARVGQHVPLLQGDDLIWAQIPMGSFVLQVGFSPDRRDIRPLAVALLIIGIGAVIVLVASILIVQRIARPLDKVSEMARRFRGSTLLEPLPEQGPRELVALAHSFNTMAIEVAELISNRTTLLAGISHDLRTPLARMLLLVELLPENVDPKLKEGLSRNFEEMDRLLTETLQFAKGLAGADTYPVALQRELEEFIEQFHHEGVSLEWRGPDDFEPTLDVGALRRLLTNLVENAVRYAGSPVLVTCKMRGDCLRIKVMDSGPGIPPEMRERIFQPFYRLEPSRSAETGGSGLGLAIVKQLCDARGWQIAVRERRGGGVVFELEIPLEAEASVVSPG